MKTNQKTTSNQPKQLTFPLSTEKSSTSANDSFEECIGLYERELMGHVIKGEGSHKAAFILGKWANLH